jgi:AcrR family transcriptional regulator
LFIVQNEKVFMSITTQVSSGGRLSRKKEKRTKNIINTAVTLFREQGIDATTMEQIAEEADVAKGTLYNYFPVKEAIISAYIQRSFAVKNKARLARIQELPDTRSRMEYVFGELVEGVQQQPDLFTRYLVYRTQTIVSVSQDDDAPSGIHRLALRIIELGQQNGEIRTDLPVYVLKDLFEFAFIEVVKQLAKDSETITVPDAVKGCVDIFINGAAS